MMEKNDEGEIRQRLQIIVGMLRQGSGLTNNGNTARKVSANYEIIAKITEIREQFFVWIKLNFASFGFWKSN